MFLRLNIKLKGDSGAGGAGGAVAENIAKNFEIDSSKGWMNNLKPQGKNPEAKDRLTKEERIDMLMDQLHISRDEAAKYATALEKYGEDTTISKQTAKDLEAFIKKAPRWAGGNTYKGMEVDAEAFDKSNSTGKIVSFNKTSTWYSNKEMVDKNVVLVSETQSKGTGINHLSVHPGNKEVLSSDESQYKIKRKYWEGKTLYVQVVEV